MLFYDPFAPVDQMLGRAGGRTGFVPAADVTVSDGDVVLTMDLPGLSADDLHIEVLDGQLVVRGERKRPALSEGSRWAHVERAFGAFERRVQLPEGADADAIMASMDNGVLSLIVPKPERLRPRTIQIRTSDRQELSTADA